ncbi:MAG: class I tRNA ligase family protein [Candidatus Vogelbacteria bacterium]|nr:class I tRNA ligase family protein [Candidatus Vogelbacteria bacterium]
MDAVGVSKKKPMRQWVIKITDYADRLLADLDGLNWPEPVKVAQRNWIGRSEGAEIEFKLKAQSQKQKAGISVFTTRADTLFGVTYVVLAPEHELIKNLKLEIKNWDEVQEYIEKAKKETDINRTSATKEKTGVKLEGITAINPANNEEVPVFIADYVLASYGTGAVMAVPAHDQRDWEFAKKYHLPIRHVIEPEFVGSSGEGAVRMELPFEKRNAVCAVVRNPKNGKYMCNSWKSFIMHGLFTGGIEEGEDPTEAARREVLEETGYKNLKLIRKSSVAINTYFYHRVKKQNRHAHFQFVFFDLENDECQPVDEKESVIHEVVWKSKDELKEFFTVFEGDFILNILDNDDYVYIDSGLLVNSGKFDGLKSKEAMKSITEAVGGRWVTKYKLRDWVFSRQRYWGEPIPLIHCEKCGVVGVPEQDLPVELPKVKSYEPTGTGESPLADIKEWVNVMCPQCSGAGKRETNTMPQWAGSSWYYLRYIDPQNNEALVDKAKEKYWSPVDMYVGGMEHATRHLIYARFWHKFLYDLGVVNYLEPFTELKTVGLIAAADGRKMSKRWGNVINPDEIVDIYGADTLRVYEMFMGPFGQGVTWSTESMMGSRRFLDKIWRIGQKTGAGELPAEAEKLLHQTIKKVGADIASFDFNTAVSSMMMLANELDGLNSVPTEAFESFLKILAPFAPHITEELWANLGHQTSIHLEAWPTFDEAKLTGGTVTIAVQVNGKARDSFEVTAGLSQAEVEKLALARPVVQKWVGEQTVKKVVYVPDRLISFVV